mmetsp:Transcript_58515/g.130368  ORF Transcript_58515/g.130368 Transcript_58515/m.130368 type:complete len:251 (+) Transcript_58515:1202-1954(+)
MAGRSTWQCPTSSSSSLRRKSTSSTIGQDRWCRGRRRPSSNLSTSRMCIATTTQPSGVLSSTGRPSAGDTPTITAQCSTHMGQARQGNVHATWRLPPSCVPLIASPRSRRRRARRRAAAPAGWRHHRAHYMVSLRSWASVSWTMLRCAPQSRQRGSGRLRWWGTSASVSTTPWNRMASLQRPWRPTIARKRATTTRWPTSPTLRPMMRHSRGIQRIAWHRVRSPHSLSPPPSFSPPLLLHDHCCSHRRSQ